MKVTLGDWVRHDGRGLPYMVVERTPCGRHPTVVARLYETDGKPVEMLVFQPTRWVPVRLA